jgi:hypothetical protein
LNQFSFGFSTSAVLCVLRSSSVASACPGVPWVVRCWFCSWFSQCLRASVVDVEVFTPLLLPLAYCLLPMCAQRRIRHEVPQCLRASVVDVEVFTPLLLPICVNLRKSAAKPSLLLLPIAYCLLPISGVPA